MTTVVITGGPDIDLETIASVCEGADRVICADSGAQNALLAGIRIDKVVGDLDSLSDEAKAVLKEKNITVDLYPVEKDMTDTEIAIREIPADHEIRLISSLSGRQDHLMTNILLAVKLRGEGRDISVTDGVTDMIPMSGEDSIVVDGIRYPEGLTVSLVPLDFTSPVKGVTTKGLYYELNGQDLLAGSSFSISNKLKDGATSFGISIKSGNMAVIITPTR